MAILPYRSDVTVAAASKDLTILATVKDELGETDTDSDNFLTGLIQQASDKAVELSGREFAEETMKDYFRNDSWQRCADVLQLSRRPIKSVISIIEDGVTLEPTDFEIIAETGWIQRIDSSGNPQSWGGGKIAVEYVAGWISLTEIPSLLERIVIDEIKREWFARGGDPIVKSEEVPGVLRRDFWIPGSTTGVQKDPMLTALEDAGFIETII